MTKTRRTTAHRGVLALLCAAQLVLMVDFSVVNLALPGITSAFAADPGTALWTVTGYAVAFGALLPLGGRLADTLGRRRMFVTGLGVFGAASLIGGLSPWPALLLAMRALQGGAAALIAPALLSLLTTVFPAGPATHRALAWFGAATSSGFSLGVVVGGLLTEFASWRAVLLINVPLVAVAVPLAGRLLPSGGPPARRRPRDLPGAVTGTTGCVALLLGISEAGSRGWDPSRTGLPLCLGLGLLGLFVLVERRAAAPLVPPGVFRSRSVAVANTVTLLVTGVMGALTLLLSVFLQDVRELSPLATGAALLPLGLVTAAVSHVSPRLMAVFAPRRVLAGGVAVFAVGLLVLGAAVESGYDGLLWIGMAVCGAGFGPFFTTATVTATQDLPAADQGLAGALISMSTQIGTALGIAFLVSLAERHPGDTASGIALAMRSGAAALAVAVALTLGALRERRSRHGPTGA
ncbi:MFS transporter [Streptomyces sp. HF10]|uniref:MFS transporter n=1 Tax=Streptomyces sp. HF10 TaxID=2692233 RepID=UPI0013176738|nr:MFS transporter [Streptomyces sp. HF10]QHC32448.1 MFS transporter [Streptomyces sp. HF10]